MKVITETKEHVGGEMRNPGRIKALQEALAESKAATASLQLNVFVAGPYVDLEKDYPLPSYGRASARLRHYLVDQIEGAGNVVQVGEHGALLEEVGKRYTQLANAHVSELTIAKEKSHALIVIPDSPGSFAELGTWASDEALCNKMLILADQTFKDSKGYVNIGPFILASHSHARLHFIDYADLKAALAIVSDFLDFIASREQVRRIKK